MTTRKVWWDKDEGFPTIEEAKENGIKSLKEEYSNYELTNFEFPYQYDHIGKNGERLYSVTTKADLIIPMEELDKYAKSILDLLDNMFIYKFIAYPADKNDDSWEITMTTALEDTCRVRNLKIEYKDGVLKFEAPTLAVDISESKYKDSIIDNVNKRRLA